MQFGVYVHSRRAPVSLRLSFKQPPLPWLIESAMQTILNWPIDGRCFIQWFYFISSHECMVRLVRSCKNRLSTVVCVAALPFGKGGGKSLNRHYKYWKLFMERIIYHPDKSGDIHLIYFLGTCCFLSKNNYFGLHILVCRAVMHDKSGLY